MCRRSSSLTTPQNNHFRILVLSSLIVNIGIRFCAITIHWNSKELLMNMDLDY